MSRRGDGMRMYLANALPVEGRDPWATAADHLLGLSGCEILRWSTSNRGVAYTKSRSGHWWIVVPQPRGAKSYAVFAHEVAHHMLHRGNGAHPRWKEEIEAWRWALDHWFELPDRDVAIEFARTCVGYSMWKGVRVAKDPARLFDEMLTYARVHDLVPIDEPRGWLPYITRRIELMEAH